MKWKFWKREPKQPTLLERLEKLQLEGKREVTLSKKEYYQVILDLMRPLQRTQFKIGEPVVYLGMKIYPDKFK